MVETLLAVLFVSPAVTRKTTRVERKIYGFLRLRLSRVGHLESGQTQAWAGLEVDRYWVLEESCNGTLKGGARTGSGSGAPL